MAKEIDGYGMEIIKWKEVLEKEGKRRFINIE